jgi:two-component system nitrogen regulation sensor histidine kinase GlnL
MSAVAINTIPAQTVELLDRLTTGIAVLDGETCFVHANPAFVELTGVARLRGCPLAALGSAAATLSALIERVRSNDAALSLRGFGIDTRDPPLRVDVAVSPWASGGCLLELHPVPLEQTNPPRLSESLRGLAHEVKNPLAGLRGAAQLLKRRVVEPDLQRLADLIIAEADRLGALTDRLLHPGGKPHLSAVNLHEVSERVRALIAAEAAPTVKLVRDYDPSLPSLRGDGDRLQQLLLNLMRNAVQAAATSVVVRTRAEHAIVIDGQPVRLALRLDVIDDGAGVPDAMRDTLFLPLVSGRVEGTGLGLALAQEIAREHAGQLSYRSRPGHTTFTLLLPLEHAHG